MSIAEHTGWILRRSPCQSKADSIASKLVDLGIRAIWNFAHVDLEIPNKDVVVESVHLSDSLMQLSYNIVKKSKNK